MSWSGPSGCGVSNPSHIPRNTRAVPALRSQNACRRAVFPAPASPVTTTIPPRPDAPSSIADSSAMSSRSRSTSSTPAACPPIVGMRDCIVSGGLDTSTTRSSRRLPRRPPPRAPLEARAPARFARPARTSVHVLPPSGDRTPGCRRTGNRWARTGEHGTGKREGGGALERGGVAGRAPQRRATRGGRRRVSRRLTRRPRRARSAATIARASEAKERADGSRRG